ncbi:alpha/beta hydrolase [Pseudonocardia alni]|uniref:alpha/beta hydrolase n=1 Tax=Pseudonocardia alni TaxID=33907 RepID=UPI00280AABC5|nr:hypothetical protein [Pseudonocardia alni]
MHHAAGVVPATFWSAPAGSADPPPLTLLQHGGAVHARHPAVDELANAVAVRTGGAVLLVDGPIHGRRRSAPLGFAEMLAAFEAFWRDDGGIDAMVSDWRLVLDVVLDRGWADPGRVAWLGVSMGTAYGIPVCAADPRIRAAAFGMWGLSWGRGDRLVSDAARLTVPALFQIKEADEIFPVAGQRALFDALGSPDKRLSTFAGGHSLSGPGQLDQLLDFTAAATGADRSEATR